VTAKHDPNERDSGTTVYVIFMSEICSVESFEEHFDNHIEERSFSAFRSYFRSIPLL
jgi:antirestriction protein